MATSHITIRKGSTYRDVLQWKAGCSFAAITAITKAAPCRITAPAHGIPDGWTNVKVESVQGMDEVNGWTGTVKVIDANTIELPCLNSLEFSTYKAGGVLRFGTPVDTSGYTSRMEMKDRVGGTVILALDTTGTADGTITIDPVAKTITREIPAVVTTALTAKKGVWDMEMVLGSYVTQLYDEVCTFNVTDEVTT